MGPSLDREDIQRILGELSGLRPPDVPSLWPGFVYRLSISLVLATVAYAIMSLLFR